MQRLEVETPVAAARHASAPKRIVDDIMAAQRALVEARGRLIEARDRGDFESVLAALRRATTHVDGAAQGCCAMKREAEEGE